MNPDKLISDSLDALLIVPPFVNLKFPSLAVHGLQAGAREQGFSVGVLYSNMLLASILGVETYNEISHGNAEHPLAGEYLLASLAYGISHAESDDGQNDRAGHRRVAFGKQQFKLKNQEQLDFLLEDWLEKVVSLVEDKNISVVGCTSSFDQTAAALAILGRIKTLKPEIVTVMGGANCEGEMAQGLSQLKVAPDYIFEGESDDTFVEFLKRCAKNKLPVEKVIEGKPCVNMDTLPRPDMSEYFQQLDLFLSEIAAEDVSVTYETSRGCWWGAKAHCTFCGLNGLGMEFREKSADKVISDLKHFMSVYPTRKVFMTDNIMPFRYFKTLVPRLAKEVPSVDIFYEQKSNLSLEKIVALKAAGINMIQPGIEALSTPFLQRMKKGVKGSQNIATLRYARSAELRLGWNLLFGFPGDQRAEYEETARIIPLLSHLKPPIGVFKLSVDRFSPYFEHPEQHGVTNIKPVAGYETSFPPEADLNKIAYHFTADYPTVANRHPELVEQIEELIFKWQTPWQNESSDVLPVFHLQQTSDNIYLLYDTRGLAGTKETQFLTFDQALLSVTSSKDIESQAVLDAVDASWGLIQDGQYVPLATAAPELLQEFEQFADAKKLPHLSVMVA